MAEPPTWISPGDTATVIWYEGVMEGPDGVRRYQIAGPVFDVAPASPYFLLVPVARDEFAADLCQGRVDLPALRGFLAQGVLAKGEMVEAMQFVAAHAEAPALDVLDAWRTLPDRPVLPYLADIGAFLPDELPLYVTPEAHAAALAAPEAFGTAWVCEECGEAEDAGVFLWTAHRGGSVRVCFLIRNDAGVWTCGLHPFEFPRDPKERP